jgi:DNA-binding beta-propeller fold protein YncE
VKSSRVSHQAASIAFAALVVPCRDRLPSRRGDPGSVPDSALPTKITSARSHPSENRVTSVVASGRPFGIAISRTDVVYCTLLDLNRLVRIPLDNKPIHAVEVGAVPTDVAFSPSGTWAYVANQFAQSIGIVEHGAVKSRISLGVSGFGLALTPDQTQIWITSPSAGEVVVLDRVTLAIQKRIRMGGTPRWVAFSTSGKVAGIANEAGTIGVIR